MKKILDNRITKYHYHVFFNLGVNDVQYDNGKIKRIFNNYFNEYEKLANKYSDVDFYLLSINPIDEKFLNES